MEQITYVRYRYLDASAALKIVLTEAGSEAVRSYVLAGGPFYIMANCVSEVLSVLKVKCMYRKEIPHNKYVDAAYEFLALLRGFLHVEDVKLEDHSVFLETEKLAKQYGLDLVDALQLFVLGQGKHSDLTGPSKSWLITADELLAKAARAENINVWDCMNEPPPPEPV